MKQGQKIDWGTYFQAMTQEIEALIIPLFKVKFLSLHPPQ